MKKLFTLLVALAAVWMPVPLCVMAESEPVSLHKYYSLVTPSADGYSDDGRRLTDGVFGEAVQSGAVSYYYKSDAYVGFSATDAEEGYFVIIVDLGEMRHDLCLFEVSLLNETDVGIYMPSTVTVSVSDELDGEYRDVGLYLSNEPSCGGISQPVTASVRPPSDVGGRYIKFSLKHLREGYGWVFVDEISVYGSETAESEEVAEQEAVAADAVKDDGKKSDGGLMPWILIGVSFGLIIFTAMRDKHSGIY